MTRLPYRIVLAFLLAALVGLAANRTSAALGRMQAQAAPQTASPAAPAATPSSQPAVAPQATPAPQAVPAPPEPVGKVTGDDVTVAGPSTSSMVTESGTIWSIVSGAQITLRAGQAKLELAEGGEIDFSAPAHVTMFKSGGGIVMALDYGLARMRVDAAVPLTVYTPLIIATPISIGRGSRDITLGLNQEGEMCALAKTGATRLVQQFSTQSIVLPQGAEANLTGGQLDPPGSGTLDCHFPAPVSRTSRAASTASSALQAAPPPTAPAAATSAPLAGADAAVQDLSNVPADGKLETHVEMPPLSFDAASVAAAPAATDPPANAQPASPALGPSARAAAADPPKQAPVAAVAAPPPSRAPQQAAAAKPHRNFFAKMFGIFHKHKPAPA